MTKSLVVLGVVTLVAAGCMTVDKSEKQPSVEPNVAEKAITLPADKIIFGLTKVHEGRPLTVLTIVNIDGQRVTGGQVNGIAVWKISSGMFDGKILSYIQESGNMKWFMVNEVKSNEVVTLAILDLNSLKPVPMTFTKTWPRLSAPIK